MRRVLWFEDAEVTCLTVEWLSRVAESAVEERAEEGAERLTCFQRITEGAEGRYL